MTKAKQQKPTKPTKLSDRAYVYYEDTQKRVVTSHEFFKKKDETGNWKFYYRDGNNQINLFTKNIFSVDCMGVDEYEYAPDIIVYDRGHGRCSSKYRQITAVAIRGLYGDQIILISRQKDAKYTVYFGTERNYNV